MHGAGGNKRGQRSFDWLLHRSLHLELMGYTVAQLKTFSFQHWSSLLLRGNSLSHFMRCGVYTKWIWTDRVLYINLEGVRQPDVPTSFRVSERQHKEGRTQYLRVQGKNCLQGLESLLSPSVKQVGSFLGSRPVASSSFLGDLPLSYRRGTSSFPLMLRGKSLLL